MSEAIVIRQRRDRHFTILGNEVIRDARLSWRARGVLVYLLSLADGFRLKESVLVNRATERRHALRGALGELKTRGYLAIRRERGSLGRFTRTTWMITDTPVAQKADPGSDFQTLVDQNLISRPAEEQTVYREEEPIKTRTTTTTTGMQGGGPAGALIFPKELSERERVVVDGLLNGTDLSLAQEVLDEFVARRRAGGLDRPMSYLASLVRKARCGEFVPDLGLAIAAQRKRDAQAVERAGERRSVSRASDEFAEQHLRALAEFLGVKPSAKK